MILLDEFFFAALCVLCYCYGCTVCSCVSGVFFFSSFLDKLPGGFCLVLQLHMPMSLLDLFSEVLKQVWDLSDQDNDSMLSLREFCCALYMMERYREGRPLPAALPSNIMYDETLLSLTGQPKVTYANAAWGPSPGIDLNFF